MGTRVGTAAAALAALGLAAGLPRAAFAQPTAAQPPLVTSVELHVPPGVDPEDLPSLITVRKGQPLSRRAVRESISRLWDANRFANVVVRALGAAGGVRVVFEVTPKSCIKMISVENNGALNAEAVKKASGLKDWSEDTERCPEEAEYYDERLRQAVEGVQEAYRQHGFYAADVAVELFGFVGGGGFHREHPGGVVLVFRIKEGSPTRLLGVTVAGDPGMPLPELLREIDVEVGEVLDQVELDKGIKSLRETFQRRRYYRARIGEAKIDRDDETAIVTLPVDAGPRYDFHFRGNRSFSDALLRGALNYDGSEMLDPVRLERRLAAFYRYRGFPDAVVSSRELLSPDAAQAVLAFDIDEGRLLQVSEISTTPHSGIVSDQELRDRVAELVREHTPELSATVHMQAEPLGLDGRMRKPAQGAPLPEPQSVYIEDAFTRAADSATERYRDHGYLNAQVNVTVERDLLANRAKVRFEIYEGPQALVAQRSVLGAPPGLQLDEVLDELGLRVGRPLSAGKVDEGRQALLRKLTGFGYLFAKVRDVTTVAGDGSEGSVEYEVRPGRQVRAGAIVSPPGLRRADIDLLHANLRFHTGDVLTPEKLFESQRNLMLTGAYRRAAVDLKEPEIEGDTKDVEVLVTKRARYSGEWGFGISSAEGPRLLVDADAPNVGGRGLNIGAHGRVNYFGASALALFPGKGVDPRQYQLLNGLGGRGNVSATYPLYALLPAKIRARGDLVAERLLRPAYWFARFAAIVGLDWTAPPLGGPSRPDERRAEDWLTANVQYELENDTVELSSKLSQAVRYDPTHLNERFEVGNYTLQNLRSSVNLRLPFPKLYASYLADPANFDHGVSLSGTGELTRDFALVDPYFTFKASGNASFYLSFARRWVLALSGRAGRIFHLAKGGPRNTITPKRFFLGGYATMRGFGEDALVSEDRRIDLRRNVANCRALISQAGCSVEAQQILQGTLPMSDGGDVFGVGKIEIRFPAFGNFDLGLFVEAGNLWLAMPAAVGEDSLRYVAGVGLRYATFIGPVALDLGFNLRPDTVLNEPIANVHFNIGLF